MRTRKRGTVRAFHFMAIIPAYKVVNNHFSAPPGKIGLLYGEHSVFPTATLVASEIIKRNKPVVFVDGANRVDPYYLAKLARYKGSNPSDFLKMAYVSRAFTCYQLEVTINEGLFDFMQSVNSTTLVLYGIIDLMDDEQVPMKDVFEIMRSIRRTLFALRSESISTLMVSKIPHFQIQKRENLFQSVKNIADVKYRLERYDYYQKITIEGNTDGKNHTNSNHVDRPGASKLVELPQGSQKRGSNYSR